MFDLIRDYRVLFVGDGIIDEYVYVSALSKSPKEHLIVTKWEGFEGFRGGVWAAAGHLSGFVKLVHVCAGGMVTVKRRFVDPVYLRKLFEVQMDEPGVRGEAVLGDWDLVVVTDFGHGALDGFDLSGARYLAINVQTNASNFGFNLVTKYDKADFCVCDEPEARLAAHDRVSPIRDVMQRLRDNHFEKLIVTHGSFGAYGLDNTGFYHVPAFTDKVVDTMGAGDAFFSITAPLAKAGVSMPELLRIGNAAGALKTQIVGHRNHVTKEALVEFLQTCKTH